MDRTILVASFIPTERLDWFINLLNTKFKIQKDKIFVFKNIDDETKLIVTFKILLKDGKKINLSENLPNATIIHKKGNAIYTINALNTLIELDSGLENGNINHKNYKVDWSKYQNKMIMTNKNNLTFLNIERIF